MHFVDRVKVRLQAGDGGAGVVSYKKQRGKPKGKPAGGSGGKGGDVILFADPSVSTLWRYQRTPHQSAGSGSHGSGEIKHGRKGTDLRIPVPPGTMVFDDTNTLIADLAQPGQSMVALIGGRGGKGNAALVTSRNRNPSVCEQGEYGREAWYTLELKLLADAALVGFPNAGKSTLIRKVTAARPKVADYPFTTLEPNLGVVSAGESEFVLVDVPGLIEGAAEGKGLGHEFLRHVERSGVIVYLLDPAPAQPLSAVEQLTALRRELAAYSPALTERSHLVVIGKADLPEAQAALEGLPDEATAQLVSGLTGQGTEQFIYRVSGLVEANRDWVPDREGFLLHRPVPTGVQVNLEEDGWRVSGESALRAVALADLTTDEAIDLVVDRLKRWGVVKALEQAGVAQGDTILIGDFSFEWVGKQDIEPAEVLA